MIIDAGKDIPIDVSDEQINKLASFDNVRERVWRIGLRNILMDSHASVKYDDFETEIECRNAKRDKAMSVLEAMLAGESRVARERAPKADDFTTAMRRFVVGLFTKDERKVMAKSPDHGVALIDARFAKNEAKLRPLIEDKIARDLADVEAKAKIAVDIEL